MIILVGFTIGGLTLVKWVMDMLISPLQSAATEGGITPDIIGMIMMPATYFFILALICIVIFIISHSNRTVD